MLWLGTLSRIFIEKELRPQTLREGFQLIAYPVRIIRDNYDACYQSYEASLFGRIHAGTAHSIFGLCDPLKSAQHFHTYPNEVKFLESLRGFGEGGRKFMRLYPDREKNEILSLGRD